ncbi:MAG: hypothetical protein WA667_30225 [Candidatus Nitrosopolaris sp.]
MIDSTLTQTLVPFAGSGVCGFIISFNRTPPSTYYQTLLPCFDKCIQITNDESDGSLFAKVDYRKKEDSRII